MSDTPRTDAASRMAFSGEYMVPIQDAQKLERDLTQSKEANAGLMRACDKYESELADAKETIEMLEIRHGATMLCHQAQMDKITKQRDALAEALSPFVTLNPLSKRVQEKWHGYVFNAKQALAAVKGGSHE
jgi:hypothetical protein